MSDSVRGNNLKPTDSSPACEPAVPDSSSGARFIETEPFASQKFPPTGEVWKAPEGVK